MQFEITVRYECVLIRIVKIRGKNGDGNTKRWPENVGNDDGHSNCWWEFKMDKAGVPRPVRAMGPRCLVRIPRPKSWRLFSLLVYPYLLGKPTSLFFPKSSWSFCLVFFSTKLTANISPDVG